MFQNEMEWRRNRREGIPGAYGSLVYAVVPPILLASLIGAGGALGAGLLGKSGDIQQKPLRTKAQAGSENLLTAFAQTGKTPWGYDFTKGYGGSLGNYDISGLENQGLGAIAQNLTAGNPAIFNTGVGEINKLLTTESYNPNDDGGVYSGLTAGIDRNTQFAIDAAKRASSYMGNLYSTNAGRGIGDISATGAINKSNILAGLYQNFSNQKLAGASAAVNAGAQDQSMSLARIGQAFQYGSLPRTLEDLKSKDAYNAWLTQRNSELAPINAANAVLGATPNFGVESVPIESPWAKLLGTTATVGANLYGQYQQGEQNQAWINALQGTNTSFTGASAPPFRPFADSTWLEQYNKAVKP